MTFSICVRETADSEDGPEATRYGVAVTTRRPSVGSRCPYVSGDGAIASQSRSNPKLGSKGLAYLSDSLRIEDALEALLHADEDAAVRQVHGVDADGTFAYSGEECLEWYGHREGKNYTVAGNVLTGPEVVEAVADTYEGGCRSDPLPRRLIDALAAGYEAGGDRRDRRIQSAACVIRSADGDGHPPFVHDLRVDASETPVEDLRSRFELARRGAEEG